MILSACPLIVYPLETKISMSGWISRMRSKVKSPSIPVYSISRPYLSSFSTPSLFSSRFMACRMTKASSLVFMSNAIPCFSNRVQRLAYLIRCYLNKTPWTDAARPTSIFMHSYLMPPIRAALPKGHVFLWTIRAVYTIKIRRMSLLWRNSLICLSIIVIL